MSVAGFGKTAQSPPDVLHTFYSLAYLSLSGGVEGLGGVDVELGCDAETGGWIRDVERTYEEQIKEKEELDAGK